MEKRFDLGIGDWGLGIGDWGLAQSPIPKIQEYSLMNSFFIFTNKHENIINKINKSYSYYTCFNHRNDYKIFN